MKEKKHLFKPLVRAVRVTLTTMFRLSPRYMAVKLSMTVAQGLIPAVLTWLSAFILAYLSQISTSGALAACILLLVADWLLGLLNEGGLSALYASPSAYEGRLLGRKLAKLTEDKLMRMERRCFYDDRANVEKSIASASSLSVFFEAIVNTLREAVTLVGTLVLLVSVDPVFVSFVFLFSLPSFFASNRVAGKKKIMQKEYNAASRQSAHLHSLLYGAADGETKILGSRPFFFTQWKGKRDVLLARNRRRWLMDSVFGIGVSLLSNLGGILCLGIIAVRAVSGESTIADVAIAMTIMDKVGAAISGTSMRYNVLVSQLTETDLYIGFMNDSGLDEAKGGEELTLPLREIRLSDVSFSYKNDSVYAIRHVDLTVRPGEYIALVGRNGSGKTTLLKLICGLYQPTSGTIYYNGIPHTELDRKSIYRAFSVLYQDFGKYALTLSENITFGSAVEEKKRDEASAKADVPAILEELPETGYDTILDEQFDGGVNLSHGQWQRVAAARAFYKGADGLMMDEPSSAIDPLTERTVYRAVESEDAAFRFLVSHRLSYMRNTSRFVMLEHGEIIDEGTFEELTKNDGSFQKLYEIQAARYRNTEE